MQTRELRIGNLVFDTETGKTDFVTDIEEFRCGLKNTGAHYTPANEIEPIPLTAQWLLNFGFEKGQVDGMYFIENVIESLFQITESTDGFYPSLWEAPELSFQTPQVISIGRVDSVHQLQNLYYAITGVELTIK